MAIIELQQLGGPPEQIQGLSNKEANIIACAIMRGLLAGNGQVVKHNEFLLDRRTSRIGWCNSARTHYITVIKEEV